MQWKVVSIRHIGYMKKTLLILLLISVFSGCKKHQEENDFKKSVIGKWELSHVYGYGIFPPPYLPGNGNTITLSTDGIYEKWKQDTLVFRGIYSIKRKKDCDEKQRYFFYTNNPNGDNDTRISIESGKLTIGTSVCVADGGVSSYRRIP